jgi:hypothetical protein
MDNGLHQALSSGNSGSRGHRWEPHVHAPGTVLNDQFSGADSWEQWSSTNPKQFGPQMDLTCRGYWG